MNTANADSIVERFVSALGDEIESHNSLAITISDFGTLKLTSAKRHAAGFNWMDSVPAESWYDFVLVDLPLAMGRIRINIGGSEIVIKRNWAELVKALRLLDRGGLCLALAEPMAFGGNEGERFEKALNSEGYFLSGIFNTPPGLLELTSIRPVLVVIGRSKREQVFVAELEGEAQAATVAHAFMSEIVGNSLGEGMPLTPLRFNGFANLKAEQQLSRLETQYKEYDSVQLGDIASEINCVKSGESHKVKQNAIYIPMLGVSSVTHDISQTSIKHHNLFQVVLGEGVSNEYVSAFFQSALGRLAISACLLGNTIPRITRSEIADVKVALPSIDEQREIASTHKRLADLTDAISDFQSELALNPRNAAAIKLRLEDMLEQIGRLTDADKVMNLARSGESKTVEYKASFSLDIQKGVKEKELELSALKTIVAFLNTNGGVLLIGVADDGKITGVREEVGKFHRSNDRFLLHFKNQIKQRIGEEYYPFINHKLVSVLGTEVLMVECEEARDPCYLDGSAFYVRTNPATDKLDGPKLVEYVRNHFKN